MKPLIFRIYVITLAVFMLSSCEKVCDDILLTHNITITDTNNNPLPGIDLEIINIRTGYPLCSQLSVEERRKRCLSLLGESRSFPPDSGVYTIISTINITKFEHEGDVKNRDVIEVRGLVNGTEFSQQYTVRSDRCNLVDVIGPDVIVVDLQDD